MKYKKTDFKEERKLINSLKKEKSLIDKELKVIIKTNEALKDLLKTEDDVNNWIQSLPIETLNESLLFESNKKLKKFSLKDIKEKRALKKNFFSKKEEISVIESKLNLAKIDLLLKKVEIALKD